MKHAVQILVLVMGSLFGISATAVISEPDEAALAGQYADDEKGSSPQRPTTSLFELRLEAALEDQIVQVLGWGVLTEAGFQLPPGRYFLFAGDSNQSYGDHSCRRTQIDIRGNRIIRQQEPTFWARVSSCPIDLSFEPGIRQLRLGGAELQLAWHLAPGGNRYPLVINGRFPDELPRLEDVFSDGLSELLEYDASALDEFWDPGGNRYGGSSWRISACMDGERAMLIRSGYTRTHVEHYSTWVTELTGSPDALEVAVRGHFPFELDTDERDRHIHCEGPLCICDINAWLASQDRSRSAAFAAIESLVPARAYHRYMRLREADLNRFFAGRAASDRSIIIDRLGGLTRVWGHPFGDLWLAQDPSSSSRVGFWLPSEGRESSGKHTRAHGFSVGGMRIGGLRTVISWTGMEEPQDGFTIICDDRATCRFFEPGRLQISSPVSTTAISEGSLAGGIRYLQIDSHLEWFPYLRIGAMPESLLPME